MRKQNYCECRMPCAQLRLSHLFLIYSFFNGTKDLKGRQCSIRKLHNFLSCNPNNGTIIDCYIIWLQEYGNNLLLITVVHCYCNMTLQRIYEMLKANHNFGITINTNMTVQDPNIPHYLPLLWKHNNWHKNAPEATLYFFNIIES